MIELTKNAIIYSNHFNPECDEYVKKEVQCLYQYLEERVVLSDDFTLKDLFNHLEKDGETFDLIFSSCLGHYSLQLWFDEINRPGPKEDDEIDYLEIHRWGEFWDWGEIDLSIGISGIGKEHDLGISYGIGFTPLNEIKNLPLRLNEDFEISELASPLKTYVKGKTTFSVYELISAVLSEISFYGDPEKRDGTIAEIVEEVKEVRESLVEFDNEED